MAALLDRLRRLGGRGPEFLPARLGPDWRLEPASREATGKEKGTNTSPSGGTPRASRGVVIIESGPAAGRSFMLEARVQPHRADFYLRDPETPGHAVLRETPGHAVLRETPGHAVLRETPEAGRPDGAEGDERVAAHTHFDRDPHTGLQTQWDIFVRPDLRGHGLAGLIVRLSYRRLLAEGGRQWFAMRKLMQIDTRLGRIHNVGIGLIAVRIGLRPEPGLEDYLRPETVKAVRLVEGPPPGLFIELKRLPGVVSAVELDPDSGRPYKDPDHYRRLVSPAVLVRAAREGRAVIGNIDYRLADELTGELARHFAQTPAEFRNWLRALRSGARHQRG